MKITRIGTNLTVVLNDGTLLTSNSCTDDMYKQIIERQEDDFVKSILIPNFFKIVEEIEEKQDRLDDFRKSKILTVFGNSIYIESISQLILPYDLAEAIYSAELKNDKILIETYCNFWTLCCLNPDSRARTNLFWFLNRYGMTISKSGLFVAYRNVEVKKQGVDVDQAETEAISSEYTRIKFKSKKSPKNYSLLKSPDGKYKTVPTGRLEDLLSKKLANWTKIGILQDLYTKLSERGDTTTTYTDYFTGSMIIKIGKPVSMPRKDCDEKQEHTCSSGLHVAGKKWISESSGFGTTGLMVLVNPADVVAVPPSDDYGKMRTCCYYPVKALTGQVQNLTEYIPDGFEDDFMKLISYSGPVSENQSFEYTLDIPEIPELSRSKILNKLGKISASLKKVV